MNFSRALLAGGCFWCIESAFMGVFGVKETACGYTGGTIPNPSYTQVCTGTTGHYEAVQVIFDPQEITYLQILEIFWRHIDPFDPGGQFADRGPQYKTAIFYTDLHQKQLAEESLADVEALFHKKVETLLFPAAPFYRAEAEHQGYCTRRPAHYKSYAHHHIPNLQALWREKIFPSELQDRLTPLQYHVTQESGTEPPFQNAYWNHKEEGIYVDVITGEPLFRSSDKFDSGCGWPSFTRPIQEGALDSFDDTSHGMQRIEVRSKDSGSHLGHLFTDGPGPTGLRYCINSAALRFIPKSKMEEEGYGNL